MKDNILSAKEMKITTTNILKEYFKKDENKDCKALIIKANNDDASNRYVSMKVMAFADVGVKCHVKEFGEDTPQEVIANYIKDNQDKYTGIMVQEPTYKHIDSLSLLEVIPPTKDMDGLHPINQGLLSYKKGTIGIRPCTPLGVVRLLDNYNIEVAGKSVVIFGRGPLVADPLAKMLEYQNATVTKIHTKTDKLDKEALLFGADIIVSCVGKDMSDYINPDMCPNVKAIIGVGFRYDENYKQLQDFNISDFSDNVYMTPNTNGTGTATITALMTNLQLCNEILKATENSK